jgi:uncharacterized protein YbcI
LEAEISEALIQFEREYMGRGPLETKAYLVDDMVLVRLKGVLTPAETKLAQNAADSGGREVIKQMRHELLERARPALEAMIVRILGVQVRSLHTDISTVTGERIILFTLVAPLNLAAQKGTA